MTTRFLAPLWAVLLCGACASSSQLGYAPPMQDTELRDGDRVKARIAVAWLGVLECESGYELWFRVRVENPGPDAFRLEPARFELLDVILEPVGEARIEGLPAAVPAGGDATFEVAFPVPGERERTSAELGVLELRVELDAPRWGWGTRFRRVDGYASSPASDRWYGAPWASRGSVVGYPSP